MEEAVQALTSQELSENPVQLPPRPEFTDNSEEVKAGLNAIVDEHEAQNEPMAVKKYRENAQKIVDDYRKGDKPYLQAVKDLKTQGILARDNAPDDMAKGQILEEYRHAVSEIDGASTDKSAETKKATDEGGTVVVTGKDSDNKQEPTTETAKKEMQAVAKKYTDGEISQGEAYKQVAAIAKDTATVPKDGMSNVTFIDGKIKQELNDYGDRLIDEATANKKEEVVDAPERAEQTNVKELEKFLNGMDEKERRLVETMARDIPKDLPPLEYERELNWKRQQAMELINEEIRQMYR